jgi:hypothetical protein
MRVLLILGLPIQARVCLGTDSTAVFTFLGIYFIVHSTQQD